MAAPISRLDHESFSVDEATLSSVTAAAISKLRFLAGSAHSNHREGDGGGDV